MAFDINLKEKVVLITGVSSGIGMGTARQFARAGANVVGCSRKYADSESASSFCTEVEKEGSKALYVQADVTQRKDIDNLVLQTVLKFGRLDIVVSNAGENIFESVEKCDEKRWKYNMQLNLESHWWLSQACKPYLEKNGGGVIILMTSNHAYCTIPGCFPYNLSKSAMTALVQSLAIEWGPLIRSVGVAPGFIDTAGNDTWFESFPDAKAERQRTIELHPVKRIGTVDEVGALCVYLASSYSQFISGTTILMDGGRSALMQDS